MKRSSRIHFPLALCLCLLVQTVQANPCTHPRRFINGYTVDLQPLIEWWADPQGLRPLAGWKHVRGSVTKDTALGWVVTGKIGVKDQPVTFLLKNPPRDQLLRFQELKRQLTQCELAREATAQVLQRPVCTDWYSLWATSWTAPPISLMEYRDASARMAQLANALNEIRAELAPMQDRNGDFKLDAFALSLQQSYEGLPVFDYGNPQN